MVNNETILEYLNTTAFNGVTCYDMIQFPTMGISDIFFVYSYVLDGVRHHNSRTLSFEEYNNYIISQRYKKIERIRHGKQ
jgi:hypothetical protein